MSNNMLNEKGISLYKLVEMSIREKIETGEFPLGEKLPTEEELAAFFNVSRTTVRLAVDGMIEAGLLRRRQGSGTYVVKSPYSRSSFKAQPSEAVCKYIYMPFIKSDLRHSYKNILYTVTAHILMLNKVKLITNDDCRKLLKFIISLKDKNPEAIGSNPLNEDCFLNFEQTLTTHLGLELASKVMIGRSRNDMTPTMIRMSVRDSVMEVLEKLYSLIQCVIKTAEKNKGRIITGYTHWQPAQPITVEHWFIAVAEALERDYQRISESYKRLNKSPLGSCAMAGTSFEIDRSYTAKLLGFDGIITNTLDAVSSRDFFMEISGDFATLGSTISRFTQDLELWSTSEFGYVFFSDSTACCSSIMPQKKNPLSAEHIRSRSAHLSAAYMDIAMTLKGTSLQHCRDLFECVPPFWKAYSQIISILELTRDMLSGISFNYEKMKKDAENNNSVLSDVADALVRDENIPFRIAHNILALTISECIDNGKHNITLEGLNNISRKICKKELTIKDEEFKKLLDVNASIENKISEGSPSEASCKKMRAELSDKLNKDNAIYREMESSLKNSKELMRKEILKVIK